MEDRVNRRFCVAPMMDCTDRHERYFLRLISQEIALYTEMITAAAILHGDLRKLLSFDEAEHPVALQLGGSDPSDMAAAARIGADCGYDEINLNVGCPSDRVQSGRFGACLMAEPELVGDCVEAIRLSVSLPVTVKTRIGIDDRDSYEMLCAFVDTVRSRGCGTFILHARKAWLEGLSPKENRDIPPLRYDVVYRLKQDFPELEVVLNGGIRTLDEAEAQLARVDGVMMGRRAYETPYILAEVDQRFFGVVRPVVSRREVLGRYAEYVDLRLMEGVRLHQMTRHIVGLFAGLPGARRWRRHLTERAVAPDATSAVLAEAASFVLDASPVML